MQSDQNFHLCFSDDGSDDNSLSLARSLLANAEFSYEIFAHNSRSGWLGNFAFLHSKVGTEYFLFLDCEDIISSNLVFEINGIIENSNAADVLIPNYIELGWNGVGRPILAPQQIRSVPYPFRLPFYARKPSMAGAGYLIYSIQNYRTTFEIWSRLFSITIPHPTKWLVEDIALSWALISNCRNLVFLGDKIVLEHFSKIDVDATRILLNALPLEEIFAVTHRDIIDEAVDLYGKISPASPELVSMVKDVVSANYALIEKQQAVARFLESRIW